MTVQRLKEKPLPGWFRRRVNAIKMICLGTEFDGQFDQLVSTNMKSLRSLMLNYEVRGCETGCSDLPYQLQHEVLNTLRYAQAGASPDSGIETKPDEDKPEACAVHKPAYGFNDAILTPAAAFWVRLLERRLPA